MDANKIAGKLLGGTPIFCIVALAAAAGLWWSSNRASIPRAKPAASVGALAEPRGDVSVSRASEVIDLDEARGHEPLRAGDAVMTGEGGVAIELADGARARLEANSRLVIDAGAGAEMTLEFGSMSDFRAGAAPWRIRRDGQLFAWGDPALATPNARAASLAADPTAAEAAANAFDEPGAAFPEETANTTAALRGRALGLRAKRTSRGAAVDPRSVSDEEIAQSMLIQSGFFKRCALSYFERERRKAAAAASEGEAVSGDASSGTQTVLMSFTLMPTGRAAEARATGGAGDDAFKRCLADVVERVPFRRFEGSPIAIAEFPIRIE